jgi:hypothetical protein
VPRLTLDEDDPVPAREDAPEFVSGDKAADAST